MWRRDGSALATPGPCCLCSRQSSVGRLGVTQPEGEGSRWSSGLWLTPTLYARWPPVFLHSDIVVFEFSTHISGRPWLLRQITKSAPRSAASCEPARAPLRASSRLLGDGVPDSRGSCSRLPSCSASLSCLPSFSPSLVVTPRKDPAVSLVPAGVAVVGAWPSSGLVGPGPAPGGCCATTCASDPGEPHTALGRWIFPGISMLQMEQQEEIVTCPSSQNSASSRAGCEAGPPGWASTWKEGLLGMGLGWGTQLNSGQGRLPDEVAFGWRPGGQIGTSPVKGAGVTQPRRVGTGQSKRRRLTCGRWGGA